LFGTNLPLSTAMYIAGVFAVALAVVAAVEFPGAKKHASVWKLDQNVELVDSSVLTMRIALNPRNAHVLQEKVHSIADPKSANFRKYLNNRELTELVSVTESDMERVLSWARKSNFEVMEVPLNRDWITVRASASDIEAGLKTKLATWTNEVNGKVRRDITIAIE
jgi:subtilase family serine protease